MTSKWFGVFSGGTTVPHLVASKITSSASSLRKIRRYGAAIGLSSLELWFSVNASYVIWLSLSPFAPE